VFDWQWIRPFVITVITMMPNQLAGVADGRMPEFIEMMQVGSSQGSRSVWLGSGVVRLKAEQRSTKS
jgi:hypothetical protein